MGAFVNGENKAIEENRQNGLMSDREKYASSNAADKLFSVLGEDAPHLKDLGLIVKKEGDGNIIVMEGAHDKQIARFRWNENAYVSEIFGITKNFQSAEKAAEELGYALQIRSSGGSYGIVKLWD